MSQQLLSHLQQCLQALDDLRVRVAALEARDVPPQVNKGGRPKGSKNKPKDVEA